MIINELLDRLENHYQFECEGGPLHLCAEWAELKRLVVSPPPPERETALRELTKEAVELLQHVRVLDCGAHFCRYCPARSPEWNHAPGCPYEESQKHNTRAAKVRRELSALLAVSPETGWRDNLRGLAITCESKPGNRRVVIHCGDDLTRAQSIHAALSGTEQP